MVMRALRSFFFLALLETGNNFLQVFFTKFRIMLGNWLNYCLFKYLTIWANRPSVVSQFTFFGLCKRKERKKSGKVTS